MQATAIAFMDVLTEYRAILVMVFVGVALFAPVALGMTLPEANKA